MPWPDRPARTYAASVGSRCARSSTQPRNAASAAVGARRRRGRSSRSGVAAPARPAPRSARAPATADGMPWLRAFRMVSQTLATSWSRSASVLSTTTQRLRILGGERQVALAQVLPEAAARQPLARRRALLARHHLGDLAPAARDGRVDVDEHDHVGPHAARRVVDDAADRRLGQAADLPRQHLGRVQVSIGDDDVGARQRRDDDLLGELDLARHVEQQLGARHQRQVARVAAQVADRLRHPRREPAALARVLDGEAVLAQRRRDPVGQRRLSAAVDPLERDEHSRRHRSSVHAAPGLGAKVLVARAASVSVSASASRSVARRRRRRRRRPGRGSGGPAPRASASWPPFPS